MAFFNPQHKVLGKINWDKNIKISLPSEKIIEMWRVQYTKGISVEIIRHLLGGPSMDYVYDEVMELEDSMDCFKCD